MCLFNSMHHADRPSLNSMSNEGQSSLNLGMQLTFINLILFIYYGFNVTQMAHLSDRGD